MNILVDSNVILDIATDNPEWFAWSSEKLSHHAEVDVLCVNPIIYAEVSVGFTRIEDLDLAMPAHYFRRCALPWEAGFLAGKCFLAYRRRGEQRSSPLPDFYIGAHAAISGMAVLTRDASRYRTYFPNLTLIAP